MRLKKLSAAVLTVALLLSCFVFSASAAVAPIDDFTYEISSDGITITEYTGSATEVVIPDSYEIDGATYPVYAIGEAAFELTAVTSVELPEGLSVIADYAFYGCEGLTAVVIPESVKEIGASAFYDCTNLSDVLVLNSDTAIGEVALGYYYYRRTDTLVDGFVLRGTAGSTAQEYAETEGITFEVYLKPVLGDVTGDYALDVRDLVRLKKVLAGSTAADGTDADVNGDGKSTAEDLVCVKLLIVYGEDNLDTYTVTFKDADGNVLKTQKVLYGFAATAPEAPARDGYYFTGWSEKFVTVKSDLTVVAQYKADTDPTFTVESVTASAGDAVTVAVSIKNNPGIVGMKMTVEYDETVLTLTDAESGTALDVLAFTKAGVFESGCSFVWDGQSVSGSDIKNGEMLLLTFSVSDTAPSGTYPINVSYNGAIDNDLNNVSFEIKNGNVTIS